MESKLPKKEINKVGGSINKFKNIPITKSRIADIQKRQMDFKLKRIEVHKVEGSINKFKNIQISQSRIAEIQRKQNKDKKRNILIIAVASILLVGVLGGGIYGFTTIGTSTTKDKEIPTIVKDFINLNIDGFKDGLPINGPMDIKFTNIKHFTADWNYPVLNKVPTTKKITLFFNDEWNANVIFTGDAEYNKIVSDLTDISERVSADHKITYLKGNSRNYTNIDTIESFYIFGTSDRYLLLRIKGAPSISVLESINPKPDPNGAPAYTSIDQMAEVLQVMGVKFDH